MQFHKPTQYSGDKFDEFEGGEDPASHHARGARHRPRRSWTARARHGRPDASSNASSPTPTSTASTRWPNSGRARARRACPARSGASTCCGVLIRQDPEGTSYLFQRGTEVLATIDAVVAGAPMPDRAGRDHRARRPDPARAVPRRLRDRARPGGRVLPHHGGGCTSVADDVDPISPERATELTTRALRFTHHRRGVRLGCARLYRAGNLDWIQAPVEPPAEGSRARDL